MADVERKRVTLHPLKPDGTTDLTVNLYPKVFLDGIVDSQGNEVAVQEKLIAGKNIVLNGNNISATGGVTKAELDLVAAELQQEINRVEAEQADFVKEEDIEEVVEAVVDRKMGDYITEEEANQLINSATEDLITSEQAQELISESTEDFITSEQAQELIREAIEGAINSEYGYDNEAA